VSDELVKVLVTGSQGFVGAAVSSLAQHHGWSVVQHQRNPNRALSDETNVCCIIDAHTDWTPILRDVDCIVHCAAHVHQMNSTENSSINLYDEVNHKGTLNLARQAAQFGVKRFVFLSSIKVNGEWTKEGQPFTRRVAQAPEDAYGLSKYHAERGLREIEKQTGIEVVIIRPPLVYGPGVKANFLSMMKAVDRRIPLPFAAISNQRSLVYLDNLVDLIVRCCSHPKAAGQTFLVTDGQDVSIAQLLRMIGHAMGKSLWLIPIPAQWLSVLFLISGKGELGRRLLGSLQLDISETERVLGWRPPYTLDKGIQTTVDHFVEQKRKL
jgi:nucleoside-diphosphate-sugar epimerase